MAAAKSVRLLGGGGVVWEFDLPLAETYADQVRNGHLTAADEESEKLLAASEDLGDENQSQGPTAPPLSGKGSGRAAWASYAAELGVAVTDDMKKPDIVAAVKGN